MGKKNRVYVYWFSVRLEHNTCIHSYLENTIVATGIGVLEIQHPISVMVPAMTVSGFDYNTYVWMSLDNCLLLSDSWHPTNIASMYGIVGVPITQYNTQ